MSEIRAFVGHSFASEDSIVIRAFSEFFDQLSRSAINFTWEHAKSAEPRVLADKVKSLMAGKNVFIGICTRRECVIEPNELHPALYPRAWVKTDKNKLLWRTTDWVIQEIGYAIGRNLPLILLLEDGVEKPGGLQGDIEYIRFDRRAPERVFGNILEMINSLSPRPPAGTALSSESKSPGDVQTIPDDPSDAEWRIPRPEWTRGNYEITLMRMVASDDTDGINSVTQAFLHSGEAGQPDSQERWEAFGEYMRLLFGRGGSLSRLKELARTRPNSCGTLEHLALGLSHFEDHLEAAKTFEAVAERTSNEAESVHLLGRAAIERARAGASEDAWATIDVIRGKAKEDDSAGEMRIMETIREVAELEKNDALALGCMERIIEINPDDIRTRFALAYRHSERAQEDVALLHYSRISARERDGATWNNLGVSYERSALPVKSVRAYRAAERMGETLAMSNLANKFVSAGFLDEAQGECDKALNSDRVHENVGHTLAKLKGLPTKEDREEEEVIRKARPKSDFYRQLGRALAQAGPKELPVTWEGPECKLAAALVGADFTATGSYEVPAPPPLGFGGALHAAFALSSRGLPDRFRVEYSGTLRGRAIIGYVKRTKEGDPPKSLLGSLDDMVQVLITLSDNEMSVMENPYKGTPRFYSMRSIENADG
jgi:tetratricopeptide (TPR) repeat protein